VLCSSREPSPAAPAVEDAPSPYTAGPELRPQPRAGSLQEDCWHRSGYWQRVECCVRELLPGLGECLMFKRSET